jgi:hypothetical protein
MVLASWVLARTAPFRGIAEPRQRPEGSIAGVVWLASKSEACSSGACPPSECPVRMEGALCPQARSRFSANSAVVYTTARRVVGKDEFESSECGSARGRSIPLNNGAAVTRGRKSLRVVRAPSADRALVPQVAPPRPHAIFVCGSHPTALATDRARSTRDRRHTLRILLCEGGVRDSNRTTHVGNFARRKRRRRECSDRSHPAPLVARPAGAEERDSGDERVAFRGLRHGVIPAAAPAPTGCAPKPHCSSVQRGPVRSNRGVQ